MPIFYRTLKWALWKVTSGSTEAYHNDEPVLWRFVVFLPAGITPFLSLQLSYRFRRHFWEQLFDHFEWYVWRKVLK